MVIRALLAVLLAASAWAGAPPVKKTSPVDEVVGYDAPSGWKRVEYANADGADAIVSFEDGDDRMRLSLYGAPKSFYKTPAAFLKGPAATTMGRPPEPAGEAVVAGRKTALYRRGFPLQESDPGVPVVSRVPRMGTEIFCVLPARADGRFVVVSYMIEADSTETDWLGKKDWNLLLKSIRRSPKKSRSSGRRAGSLDSGGSGASPLQ